MKVRGLNISLRAEIVINILILMGMAIITVGIMVLKISENNMVNMRIESKKALLTSLRKTVEDGYVVGGKMSSGKLQRLIDDFAPLGGADEIVAVDTQYRIIAGVDSSQIGEIDRDEKLIDTLTFQSESVDLKTVHKTVLPSIYESISISMPVTSKGELIGGLKAVFPMDDLNNLLGRTRWLLFFFLSFDSLLLLLFGSFLLTRTIVRPLKKFVRVAERIADGDLSQRVGYESGNEIGQLSASFDRMADSLEGHVGHLERANRELKQAQQELVRSEKLASVGRLAAGVAHEVGNPLGAILGYTDMLINGVDDEGTRSDYLKRIESEIRKIDATVRELLDYSRPSKMEVMDVDVNRVVREAVSLVSHQKTFEKFELEMKFSEDMPPSKADEKQLQQVLINIILNAVDAMSDGGDLEIATESFSPKSPLPMWERDRVREKSQVRISIRDSGCGINDEDLKKVFDPFFTTKEPGSGTGLGLSISQRIIETFGGKIEVESEVGKGSTFTIYLPVAQGVLVNREA